MEALVEMLIRLRGCCLELLVEEVMADLEAMVEVLQVLAEVEDIIVLVEEDLQKTLVEEEDIMVVEEVADGIVLQNAAAAVEAEDMAMVEMDVETEIGEAEAEVVQMVEMVFV